MESEAQTEENPLETALALKREIEKHREMFQIIYIGQFSLILVYLLVSILLHLIHAPSMTQMLIGQVSGVLIIMGIFGGKYLFSCKKRKKRFADYKNALLKVAKRDDVNAVGLLLETLLRASKPENTERKTPLRPAGNTDSDNRTLLRPMDGEAKNENTERRIALWSPYQYQQSRK